MNSFNKICELAYAKFQGKKELVRHFEKGSVLNVDSDEKKPIIRDIILFPKIEIPIVLIINSRNF